MLAFNNINKRYKKFEALKNCTFTVENFEFVGLVGNNGCGKSTTIHVLCNLTNYDSGEYFFEDKKVDVSYVFFKSQLGIILSKPYYVEEFNVIEYWKFVCKFQKVPKAEIKSRIEDLVSLLELSEHTKKPIKNLSSGNQMKVSFGAALIHNPKVLILDEPFINLDIATTEKLIGLLKGFKGKKTLFITSHSLDLIADLCEKFLIMDKGNITATLYKKDYSNIEHLKKEVKNFLVIKEESINLDWLI